jgi:hypothetical protein
MTDQPRFEFFLLKLDLGEKGIDTDTAVPHPPIPLPHGSTMLGRGGALGIRDPRVSRSQLKITVCAQSGKAFVEGGGKANPSFVQRKDKKKSLDACIDNRNELMDEVCSAASLSLCTSFPTNVPPPRFAQRMCYGSLLLIIAINCESTAVLHSISRAIKMRLKGCVCEFDMQRVDLHVHKFDFKL